MESAHLAAAFSSLAEGICGAQPQKQHFAKLTTKVQQRSINVAPAICHQRSLGWEWHEGRKFEARLNFDFKAYTESGVIITGRPAHLRDSADLGQFKSRRGDITRVIFHLSILSLTRQSEQHSSRVAKLGLKDLISCEKLLEKDPDLCSKGELSRRSRTLAPVTAMHVAAKAEGIIHIRWGGTRCTSKEPPKPPLLLFTRTGRRE